MGAMRQMTVDEAKLRKAMVAFDWLVHVYAPAFLRLANLNDEAATLEKLPKILNTDQSSYVYVRTRDIRKNIDKRRAELANRVHGISNDNIWKAIIKTFEDAKIADDRQINDEIILGTISVASEIWTVADGAAEIAQITAGVTVETIRKWDGKLEQELAELLSAA
jgi:hypothetical protein